MDMTREWNALWFDPEPDADFDYIQSIRRMMIASINWIETHDGEKPQWKERDLSAMLAAAGIDDVDPDEVAIIGTWNDFFTPVNEAAISWFDTIVEASQNGCEDRIPTVWQMNKAIAAGIYVDQYGWDAFNVLMSQAMDENVSIN